MALLDQNTLATDPLFMRRVQAAVVNYVTGTVFAEAQNDQQTVTLTGAPTGGGFTLAGGPLTGAVAPAWNDTAQALQGRLAAALAAGDACVCTGGPLPGTPVVVTWTGALGNSPQNSLTVSANNLTGGSSPNAAVSHSQVGVAAVNHAVRAALAQAVLNQIGVQQALGIYQAPFCAIVAADATVLADYLGGGLNQTAVTDAHISAAVAARFNVLLGL